MSKKVTAVFGNWKNNPNEAAYLEALRDTLVSGDVRKTRNGYTRAIVARQVRFDLSGSFPAHSTKQLALTSVLAELKWFIEGGKDSPVPYRLSISRLNQLMGLSEDSYNPMWSHDQERFAKNGNALFPGDCGRIYGAQWRNFPKHILIPAGPGPSDWEPEHYEKKSIDQLGSVIQSLRNDPFSRYHVVSAWNPAEISDMCLPPCHMKMQFFARHSRRKDKKMYLCVAMDQRSCDMFLGVPFNIASYAILLHMVAQCVDMLPGELVITLNDCHIYTAHLRQVRTQLERDTHPAPKLWLNPEIKCIDDFGMDDVKLVGYKHQGRIKAKLL